MTHEEFVIYIKSNRLSSVSEKDKISWLIVKITYGIGIAKLKKLLSNPHSTIESLAGSIVSKNPSALLRAKDLVKDCLDNEIQIICPFDLQYPDSLLETEDMPIILFAKGNPALMGNNIISIVGQRRLILSTSRRVISDFVKTFHDSGFTICSGLAIGIDQIAMEESIPYGTLQVVAHGLLLNDMRYQSFLSKILKNNGLVVSEELPRYSAMPVFTKRNRIIAALGSLLLVVQSKNNSESLKLIRSGTYSTVLHAKKYRKKIFAIPYNPYECPDSLNNILIKNADAQIALSAKETLRTFLLSTCSAQIFNETSHSASKETKNITAKAKINFIEDFNNTNIC